MWKLGTEAAQLLEKEYINRNFVAVQTCPHFIYLNISVVLIDLIDVDDSWADSDVAHMRRGAHKCSLQTNLRSARYRNLDFL